MSGGQDDDDLGERASRPSALPLPLIRYDTGDGRPPAPDAGSGLPPASGPGGTPPASGKPPASGPGGTPPASGRPPASARPPASVRPPASGPGGTPPASDPRESVPPASLALLLARRADSIDVDEEPAVTRRSVASVPPFPLLRTAPPPAPEEAPPPTLLRVSHLSVSFSADGRVTRALDGVSFSVPRGRTVALVGESGCGKTVTALSILRLLPAPYASVDAGAIELEGRDLLSLTEREMRAVRGGKIGMIFQEPMTSLNPVYTVGAQIAEAIRLHRPMSRGDARLYAVSLLGKVGLPEPEVRAGSYPHELSGGMRQRVMIAMALAPGPSLLIADEPTTALDMTTQAQILDLLERLKAESSMSLLLIAHDLAVVGELADEIVVLYAGTVVEQGPARRVLAAPSHPYTRALLRSIPAPGLRPHRVRGEKALRLPTIPGALPDLRDPPPGCRFADRCDVVFARCRAEAPDLYGVPPAGPSTGRHAARCFLLAEAGRAGEEGAA
ncbi:oligopeptide/dipeptide ABC transporter ATP-binding protein [Sorangium sp. So ce131]|uniref:ABC transporter ATP-binding protein n=1 Tax=Sorangium sp. So ce131 TaxID=3133282 RepID=UPI003F613726